MVRPPFEWLGLTNLLVLFLFKSFNLKIEDGDSLAGFLFKSQLLKKKNKQSNWLFGFGLYLMITN